MRKSMLRKTMLKTPPFLLQSFLLNLSQLNNTQHSRRRWDLSCSTFYLQHCILHSFRKSLCMATNCSFWNQWNQCFKLTWELVFCMRTQSWRTSAHETIISSLTHQHIQPYCFYTTATTSSSTTTTATTSTASTSHSQSDSTGLVLAIKS